MPGQRLVLAFFENEAAADDAVTALKQWDRANEEIRLGAIGVLVRDEDGNIKSHKIGAREGTKGAKTFAVLGALAGVLSGGLTIVGGVIGGAILGGVLGTFFRQGLGLSKDDLMNIGKQLDGGRAAVGLLVKSDEAAGLTRKLEELGGKPESFTVTDEAVEQMATHAQTDSQIADAATASEVNASKA